jgi:predicted DNA-binding transcriptional regulator AlpA
MDNPRRVITTPALKERKGIDFSRQHLDRKIREGTFPKPFKLEGSTTNFWFEDVIDAYLEKCAANTSNTA